MKKAYRLKHIPTGLYWAKKSYNRLSETGSVYTSGTHAFSGMSPDRTIDVHAEDRLVRKHMDLFKRVGVLEEHPETKWDGLACKMIPTGKTYFTWHMASKVSDFEKEFVTLEPEVPGPSVSGEDLDLIERVTRTCWDQMFNISKALMPYENLLKRVKKQLNIK